MESVGEEEVLGEVEREQGFGLRCPWREGERFGQEKERKTRDEKVEKHYFGVFCLFDLLWLFVRV